MNTEREIVDLYVDDIIPNRFQPREIFDEKALKELSASIKEHGVIQPIIVRKIGDKYEIIAGERRYKASVMAGLTKIPAIIRNLDDKESSKVALLENLQRRDLTAIEEARTYQKILDLDSMTQDELGRTMGKSQAAIANKIRLLSLPDEVQEALLNGQISERHARSLLNVKEKQKQIELLNKIITTRMTVRELDNEIKLLNQDSEPADDGGQKMMPEYQQPSMNEQNQNAPTMETPIIDMNPTPTDFITKNEVDINQIKEKSEDIVKTKEVADLSKLLQVPEPVEQQEKEEEKNYKFIPSFDEEEKKEEPEAPLENILPPFEFIQSTPIIERQEATSFETTPEMTQEIQQQSEPEPIKNPFDSFATSQEESYHNPFTTLESVETLNGPSKETLAQTNYQPFENTSPMLNEWKQNNGIVAEENNQKTTTDVITTDLKTAINTIRDMVANLERKGLTIDLEEIDLENSYQITIKIDKEK